MKTLFDFFNGILEQSATVPASHIKPLKNAKKHRVIKENLMDMLRTQTVKNYKLNTSVFFQCKMKTPNDNIYCTMFKKYVKCYMFPLKTGNHLFFMKLETSNTLSVEHAINAMNTYIRKIQYKDCNIKNTETIERVENCVRSIEENKEDEKPKEDEVPVREIIHSTDSSLDENINNFEVLKNDELINIDDLRFDEQIDILDFKKMVIERYDDTETEHNESHNDSHNRNFMGNMVERAFRQTHKSQKKSPTSNETKTKTKTKTKKLCHPENNNPLNVVIIGNTVREGQNKTTEDEIRNYERHRSGDEFYIPSNLCMEIFNFASNKNTFIYNNLIKNFGTTIKETSFIVIKNNIVIFMKNIYDIKIKTPNVLDELTATNYKQKWNDMIDIFNMATNFEDLYDFFYAVFINFGINSFPVLEEWIKQIEDIYIHCFVQREILATYKFIHNKSINIVELKRNSYSDYSNYSYELFEIPEFVICNMFIKYIFTLPWKNIDKIHTKITYKGYDLDSLLEFTKHTDVEIKNGLDGLDGLKQHCLQIRGNIIVIDYKRHFNIVEKNTQLLSQSSPNKRNFLRKSSIQMSQRNMNAQTPIQSLSRSVSGLFNSVKNIDKENKGGKSTGRRRKTQKKYN
jgi:hypothetical protein